jgi:FlaA1/EpsC-like NDP-sugar epimerase
MNIDKRILNYLIVTFLSFITFWWTFLVFHIDFDISIVLIVIFVRIISSRFIFKDYSLSWSKVSQKTFLMKSFVYIFAFSIYMVYFYSNVNIYFLSSELFLYLFIINFLMYSYYALITRSTNKKTKQAVIYGAGEAGIQLERELKNSIYKIKYFIDDNKKLQKQSIDGISIISIDTIKEKTFTHKIDLLVIAMPSINKIRIKEIYKELSNNFEKIQILPSIEEILKKDNYSEQLKDISVEDLLARDQKDLDKNKISSFIKNKIILITGAGGSIGSEICRQCIQFNAKQLILIDHSEFNLYNIEQELEDYNIVPIMQSVVNKYDLNKTFLKYKPDIVIHTAAYKHVPLVECNIKEGIVNNIIGTKNTIDCAIENSVSKFILISTDKAVRPTNVMGTTKRICELYAQNSNTKGTDIVAVRFGNVLGSSGSVIPKFKEQIAKGGPITVTHPNITRYFMLIPEACELVLQAAAIGSGGEVFILDMGEPIKILDLANRMIELSNKEDIHIEFTGLRPGEKLYEELLIDDSDCITEYESITVAKMTKYNIDILNKDIEELLYCNDKIKQLNKIVPEFKHKS